MLLTVETLHRALGGTITRADGRRQVLCPGPGHSAADRSLAVSPSSCEDGFVVYSHAGDGPIVCKDYVRERMGMEPFRPGGNNGYSDGKNRANNFGLKIGNADRKLIATHSYTDDAGAELFQVLRYEPKGFSQRRPDGNGGWIYNLDGVRRVLYRLPELIEQVAMGHPVFISEGEKDVDVLWAIGVPATCNPHGAGKWLPEYNQHLHGAKVYIIPDNDKLGREHAAAVAQSLKDIATSVRIVTLPGAVKDASDWIAAGGNAEQLYALAEAAPVQNEHPTIPDAATATEIDIGASYAFVGDAPPKPPEELIKGLIPKEGVVVTGGQSGAGKTFIKIHKAICLATAIPYFGRKITERVGTVFVAAEGRPMLPNRFAAAMARAQIQQPLPICWPKRLPDFSTTDGIKRFVAELKEIDRQYRGDYGVRLGHIPIDTVAANFSMKDEDDNAEATKICNLARSIGEDVGALIALVHHYGKDATSGLRGASAWKGSADVIEGVLADIDALSGKASNRELVCAKARDGEQGPLSPFDLEFIELGLDGDGEIYGSVCVVPAEGESRFDKGKAPGKSQRIIMDSLDEVLSTRGQIIVPRADMPQVRAARVSDVRAEFDRRYVVDATDPAKAADAKRKAFKRSLDYLSPAKFGAMAVDGADWIWRIT